LTPEAAFKGYRKTDITVVEVTIATHAHGDKNIASAPADRPNRPARVMLAIVDNGSNAAA